MTRNGVISLAVVAVVAIGAGAWAIEGLRPARAADPAPPPEIPVATAKAEVKDVPVLLPGLGTVQALNTVEIKAQVNGTLIATPVHEGQEVHKGDIIAEIDPRPYKAALDQATAQRAEDAAMLQSAQLDLRRYQVLAKRNDAPVQQVDDQQATVSKETAALAADDAAIETAQINLGYCVIRAPIDGRISLYQVDVGNLIQTSSQTGIVSITQDTPISVVMTLPEADLAKVRQAQAHGDVPVRAVDSNSNKLIATGTLLTPQNTIDVTTGTITLKANFTNADRALWPGQFVNGQVQVDLLHNAVVLPQIAINHGPDGLYVYVVKPDNTVAQVSVQTGYQDDSMAVVTKGLSGNETVVTSGQSRLAPGSHVKPSAASAAAPADAASAT